MLVIVIVLRESIADALKGLGARAKSLSLGIVAFDFGEAAVRGLTPESLDDIRDTASHAPVGDSGAALIATLTDPAPAECTVVDLGDGKEWITSRLYAVVTLVARMRGLRVMVFTASGSGGRQFIGSAQPEQVRWALAAGLPMARGCARPRLEQPNECLHPGTVERAYLSLTRDGRLDSRRAVQTFEAYKQELQAPVPPPGASGWLDLSGTWERAEWVTPALLGRVLRDCLNQRAVHHDFDTPAEELARRVLRFPFDYVPTVDRAGNFLRVVARREYASRTLRHVADGSDHRARLPCSLVTQAEGSLIITPHYRVNDACCAARGGIYQAWLSPVEHDAFDFANSGAGAPALESDVSENYR